MYRFDAGLGEPIVSPLPEAFAMPVPLLLLHCCYFSFNARDRSALLGAGSGGRDPKYTLSTRKNEGADSQGYVTLHFRAWAKPRRARYSL